MTQKNVFFAPVALLFLLLMWPGHVAIAAADIVFSVEEPQAGSVYSGVSNIRGWAVAPSGINRVELLVDGQHFSNIPMGGRRADVGGVYPGYPDSSQSGFSMIYNYSGLSEGQHHFTVRVTDNNGDVSEKTTHFTVTRFENSYIDSLTKIDINNAHVAHENNRGISIQNMVADGKRYNVLLEWRTEAQGFAIKQASGTGGPTGGSNAGLGARFDPGKSGYQPKSETLTHKPVAAADIVFSVEEPQAGSVYSGVSNIRGWAVAPSGINRVELLVDGQHFSNIPMGGRRADVGGVYPGYPDSSQSGFSMIYNYSGLSEGQHHFTVRVTDNNGDVSEKTTHFTVTRFENSYISNLDRINLVNAEIAVSNNAITIHKMVADGKSYDVTLQWRTAMQGFAITRINPAGSTTNRAPTASPLSIQVAPSVPYVNMTLIGNDPDGDVLSYELISPASGNGYIEAYVSPRSGNLYVTLDGSSQPVSLSYHVSDGLLFSSAAAATIQISASPTQRGQGARGMDPRTYGQFTISDLYGLLLGAPGAAPSLPGSVDLSPSFPTPGDQGDQGSCVGWATAYALKSYQEKLEENWDLSRQNYLFSPAFIYNQVKEPGDCNVGSYVPNALELIVRNGAATLDKMPYNVNDCTSSPSAAAMQQAAVFRAKSWGRLESLDVVKAALANRIPVVAVIKIYDSFYQLNGSDPVYNSTGSDSTPRGLHAITIVGYDDDLYGGAFKVINSWGTQWGNGGYFWLAYSFASQGFTEFYVLEDAKNGSLPDPVDPAPVPENLPNLTVQEWRAQYDARPGGQGSLEWRVVNTGTGDAPDGAYVNLILSEDQQISSSDIYVVYERIPFVLAPGEAAFRAKDNAISFNFPDTLESGTYYMALWVDDLDEIRESIETDNISLGNGQLTVENSLPDLEIQRWYAEWDSGGNGLLTYEVHNRGRRVADSGWDINLVLSTDSAIDKNDYFLAYETVPFALDPGKTVYRDLDNPLQFNLGNVTAGTYHIALWVDDLNKIAESNERNNISMSWKQVSLGSQSQAAQNTVADNANNPDGFVQAYNGKRLPSSRMLMMRKVQVSTMPDSSRQLRVLGENNPQIQVQDNPEPMKKNYARNVVIFPIGQEIPMP